MENIQEQESILIVDDQQENLQILQQLLQKKGYLVYTAETGNEALDLAHKNNPHLILLDIILPDIDGYEVCKRLKENSLTKDIPVIFISALTKTADILQGFTAGGIDYITKPFIAEEVHARVKIHLEMSQMHILMANQANKLQKAIETAELQSEEKYRNLFENSGNSICIVDDSDKIILVNTQFKDSFGYRPEQIIGKDWRKIAAPSAIAMLQKYNQRRKADPDSVPRKYETTILNAKGEERNVKFRVGRSPKLKQIIVAIEDITEYKKTDEILKSSEAKFNMAFQLSPIAMTIENANHQFSEVNQAFLNLTGYSLEETLGKTAKELRLWAYENERHLARKQFKLKGKLIHFEFHFRKKNGKTGIGILSTESIRFNGETVELTTVLDISDRKRFEIELKESESTLKSAQEIAKMGDWEFDFIKQKTRWSENTYVIFGLQPFEIEITYEYFRSRIHPDDLHLLDEGFEDLIKNRALITLELRILLPDGNIKWIQNSIVPYFEGDQIVLLKGTNIDITDRKKAELELRDSEKKYQTLTHISPVGIFRTDKQGNTTFVNSSWCQISGLSADEAMGNGWFKAVHPEDKEKIRQNWSKATHDESASLAEYRFVRPDETVTWVIGQAVPELNDEGKIIGYVGTATDISEQKKLEKTKEILVNISNTVLVSESFVSFSRLIFNELRKIINTCNFYIGLYNVRTQTISTSFIVDSIDENILEFPAEKSLTGYVIKTKKSQLIDRKLFDQLISQGEIELLEPAADIWIGVPLFSKEKVIGVIVIQNYEGEKKLSRWDLKVLEYVSPQISLAIERKKAIEELKTALKNSEASERLKTAFMNNISHEIRTPLNGILGFAPFVIQPDISQEDKEFFLQTLNTSSERLMKTVTDYIDISLIASENMKAYSNPFNINLLLKEIYTHYRQACQLKNLAFELRLPNNSDDITIQTDRELLRKALSHLVDNAVKFTEDGSIELGYSMDSNSNNIVFFVKDSGVGIEEQAQELIFKAFVQEHTSNTRAYEGSGLGLTLASNFIHLLGGEIHLNSKRNKGTIVSIQLPLIEKSMTKNKRTDDAKIQKEKTNTILVVEDDDLNFLYFEKVLKGRLCHILRAENGQLAVDYCRKNPNIDIVIMDIMLPIIDGLEATRQIKQFRNELPIIAVTAMAISGDEAKIKAEGCDDYISKPFSKSQIIERINKYISI